MTSGHLADQAAFWDRRVLDRGHTGWADADIYAYDQPIRLRAVLNAIVSARPTLRESRILDIGCGSGDLSIHLARRGAFVTGIDISREVIGLAKARARGLPRLEFRQQSLEEFVGPQGGYDIITSVTVLQHILSPEALDNALERLKKHLHPVGFVVALELAPRKVPKSLSRMEHIALRTRDVWVEHFSAQGFELVREVCVPQTAILFLSLFGRASSAANRPSRHVRSRQQGNIRRLLRRTVLSVCRPVDHWLALRPPGSVALYRLFLFGRGDTLRPAR